MISYIIKIIAVRYHILFWIYTYRPVIPPIPFKNDGSFLEQFKQLQQQSVKTEPVTQPFNHPPQPNYPPPLPPQVDVTIPPPMFLNHPPPQYLHPPPSPMINKEVKRERRSPSPYSPSRPCEDEDEQAFFNKGEWSTFCLLTRKRCWAGMKYPVQYSWVS